MSNGEDKKFDLGKTIGTIESSLGHIKETVEATNGKVDSINTRLLELNGSAVKRDECTQRTRMITEGMAKLTSEIQRKQTRQEIPSLNYLAQQQEEEVEEEVEDPKKPWLQRVRDNAAAIITILTLVGLLGAGVYKLAHVIVKVESALAQQTQKTEQQTTVLKKELRKIDNTQQKVVYVPVIIHPDAGTPTKNRRRRRR